MKHIVNRDATVIDFGAHFLPEELDTSDRGRSPEHVENTGFDRIHDPETQIDEMEEAGVDAMVHTIPTFLGHQDAERTANANDVLHRYVEDYDEYYALAAIPAMAGGEAAAAEFERSLKNGMNGGGIDETDIKLTDEEMEPVLEVANRTGAPIYVHVESMPAVNYRFNAIFGRELSLSQSICRVIHAGLYDRYPDLNIVWHHLGGNIASKLGRVHLHTDSGRWLRQDKMKPYEEFKKQFEERVYVDTAGYFGYSGPIRTALEELPSTQVLFGTDYPWEPRSGEELGRFAEAISDSASQQDAQRVLGENALELMINA